MLDVSGNELGGALPPELGRLDGLVRLVAGGNRLTGAIPASLFGLPLLDYVDLSGNELTGASPPAGESRPDMQGLVLARNRLSGPLPLGLRDLGLSMLMLAAGAARADAADSVPGAHPREHRVDGAQRTS